MGGPFIEKTVVWVSERPSQGHFCFEKTRCGSQNVPRRGIHFCQKLGLGPRTSIAELFIEKIWFGSQNVGILLLKTTVRSQSVPHKGAPFSKPIVRVSEFPLRGRSGLKNSSLGSRTSLVRALFLLKNAAVVAKCPSQGRSFLKSMAWLSESPLQARSVCLITV